MRALLLGLVSVMAVAAGAGAGRAAPAPAQPGTLVASPRFVPEAGPVFAGEDRLVWVSRRDGRVLDLWVAGAGRVGARRVQRFSGSDGERLRSARLSASALGVGLVLTVEEDGRAWTRAYRGAVGAPLAPVATPAAAAPDGVDRVVAADGTITLTHNSGSSVSFAPGGDRELLRHSDIAAGRAVWVARGCASTEIRSIDLPAPATVRPREPTCPLRLRRRARLRGERLRFGVSCAGFRVSCSARVSVRARGQVIAGGRARYNHSTPPYAAADLRVTAAGLRLLRAHPATRLRISARLGTLTRRTVTTPESVRT